jgi:imidazolonepropionase-like amidohydrolase
MTILVEAGRLVDVAALSVLADRTVVVEAGRFADLVAVDGFDLGDLTCLQRPTHVLLGGVAVGP